MMEAAGRVFGDIDQCMPLVEQLIYEQCTKECRRAITPWKGKGLQAWMKACWEIRGPLTNSGLAAAVLAAAGMSGNRPGVCFKCGQPGHIRKTCPNGEGRQRGGGRQPGLCPRCKKGRHWGDECQSVKDINGLPITNPPGSKNGKRGPRPQGPQMYGALQDQAEQPPQKPEGQPRALQGWTSVPPPGWY